MTNSSLTDVASAPVRSTSEESMVVYRDRNSGPEENEVSPWQSANPSRMDCEYPLDHPKLVIDPSMIHDLTTALAVHTGRPSVGSYMLWQPAGSVFLARPGVVLGSLTFGQTLAVKKAFVEPRLALGLLERGGRKSCTCKLGDTPPEGGEVTDLGLRSLAGEEEGGSSKGGVAQRQGRGRSQKRKRRAGSESSPVGDGSSITTSRRHTKWDDEEYVP